MTRRLTIAIDGPAASGKGTAARMLAQKLDYAYIDTGAMYRAVGLLARQSGLDCFDGVAVGALAARLRFAFHWDGDHLRIFVDGRDLTGAIRAEAAGQDASAVATLPAVRAALLDQQRALAQDGGVVMDGRDIGTVVLPQADLKVYLDASPRERARRRTDELRRRGGSADLDQVFSEISARDHQDRTRATAPLRQADDAILLDTTGLPPSAVVTRLHALVQARLTAS